MLPLFLSLVVLLCAGTDLYAKPPADAAQQELVEITASGIPGTWVDAYTVPVGKTLVIFDVNMSYSLTNTSGEPTCCALIGRNSVGISSVNLLDRNYHRTYSIGIEFKEGDIVGVNPPSSGSVFFELRGFLTDIN